MSFKALKITINKLLIYKSIKVIISVKITVFGAVCARWDQYLCRPSLSLFLLGHMLEFLPLLLHNFHFANVAWGVLLTLFFLLVCLWLVFGVVVAHVTSLFLLVLPTGSNTFNRRVGQNAQHGLLADLGIFDCFQRLSCPDLRFNLLWKNLVLFLLLG